MAQERKAGALAGDCGNGGEVVHVQRVSGSLAGDAEKIRQRRSRFAQRLPVPNRVRLRLFARCGLAGRPF